MTDTILRNNLIEVLKGGSAHVTYEMALNNIDKENRHKRPASEIHTIWEELEHIRLAQKDILQYTIDSSWESPKWPEGYWPDPNIQPTEEIWNSSLSAFLADLNEVIKLVQDPDIELTKIIPHTKNHTYLREILLISDHNAHHLGQIIQVRKLLKNW